MKTCIFISRHEPTCEQRANGVLRGYNIVPATDVDAFDIPAVSTAVTGDFDAVACVHPAIALAAIAAGKDVLIFQSVNRAAPDEPVRFECGSVQVWQATPGVDASGPVFTPELLDI